MSIITCYEKEEVDIDLCNYREKIIDFISEDEKIQSMLSKEEILEKPYYNLRDDLKTKLYLIDDDELRILFFYFLEFNKIEDFEQIIKLINKNSERKL